VRIKAYKETAQPLKGRITEPKAKTLKLDSRGDEGQSKKHGRNPPLLQWKIHVGIMKKRGIGVLGRERGEEDFTQKGKL